MTHNWKVFRLHTGSHGYAVGPCPDEVVAAHIDTEDQDNCIAAAPELLVALEAIVSHKRTDDRSIVYMPHEVEAAREAIAKARGQ
jgi:hypothetical protein